MTAYVDQWRNYGKRIGRAGPYWCHLTADTLEELHQFAQRIGLQRAWFQDGRYRHYDIGSQRIRGLALELGAQEVDARTSAAKAIRLGGGIPFWEAQ